MRMIAIVMLAAGVLALVYGGFSYTRQTHEAKVGPVEFSVSENKRVNVPMWAGIALVVVGGGLLLAVLAGLGFVWPRLLAWPLATLSLWLGLALLARAARRASRR